MRIFLVLLISLLCSATSFAADLLLGRVVAITDDSVRLEVLDGPPGILSAPGQGPTLVTVDRGALRGDIRENELVRMWGTIDTGTGRFSATRPPARPGRGSGPGAGLRSTGPGHHDATGVRRRIRRCSDTRPGGFGGRYGGNAAGGHGHR